MSYPAAFTTPVTLRPRLSSSSSSSNSTSSRRPRRVQASSMTVHRIRSPRDFQAALPASPPPSTAPLVVLSFVMPNCRACSYARAAFARLARDFVPGGRAVRFCELDISEAGTQRLSQSLGVEAVPSFQLYALKDGPRPAFGVLDQFAGARVVGDVRRRLALYSSDGFDLDEFTFEDWSR